MIPKNTLGEICYYMLWGAFSWYGVRPIVRIRGKIAHDEASKAMARQGKNYDIGLACPKPGPQSNKKFME